MRLAKIQARTTLLNEHLNRRPKKQLIDGESPVLAIPAIQQVKASESADEEDAHRDEYVVLVCSDNQPSRLVVELSYRFEKGEGSSIGGPRISFSTGPLLT